MKKYLLITVIISLCNIINAQNTTYTTETFRDTRVISGQSVETGVQGQMKFIISHRFGDIYQENAFSVLYNFFGFSGGANMRIGLDYAINNWLEVGGGRSNLDKTYDVFGKVRLLKQSTGDKNMPVSLSFYQGMSMITDTTNDIIHPTFIDGFAYSSQLLIARKFTDGFSLQLMPTFVHRNLVDSVSDQNDVIALGLATKIRLTKNIDLTGEYYYTLPDQLPTGYENAVAIGADFITKGHVFQLHLTNSLFLIPEHYITKTQDQLAEKVNGKTEFTIHFGFNITRSFKIAGRQY
ncbi:MAG: DUF5777 family beta-barrel protein [Chitinophagales bacterium]